MYIVVYTMTEKDIEGNRCQKGSYWKFAMILDQRNWDGCTEVYVDKKYKGAQC